MEPDSIFDVDCNPISSEAAISDHVQFPETNTISQEQLQGIEFLVSDQQQDQERQGMAPSAFSSLIEERDAKGAQESGSESFSKVQEYLKPAIHQCHKCGKIFHEPQHLRLHIEAEHEGVKYTCELCGSTMKWQCNLKVHMDKVHNIKDQVRRKPVINRKCRKCKLEFSSNRLYYRHLRSVHKESKPVQCVACPEKFETVVHLNSHKFTHPTLVPFRCDVCRLRYGSKTGLKKHIESSKHAQKSEYGNWDVYTEFDEFDQVCYLCQKKFSFYSSFYIHMCFGCITCKMCKKTVDSSKDLQNHLMEEHKLAPEEAAETIKKDRKAVRRTCEICNKVYQHSTSLDYHMMVHRGEKNLKCDQCDYRTYKKGDLNKHKRMHSGERPFQCPTCNNYFRSYQGRRNCLIRHGGVKSHKCSHCDKSFVLKKSLRDHVKRCHLGKSKETARLRLKVGCNRTDTGGERMEMHREDAGGNKVLASVDQAMANDTRKKTQVEVKKGIVSTNQVESSNFEPNKKGHPKSKSPQKKPKRSVQTTLIQVDSSKPVCVASPCGCPIMINIEKRPDQKFNNRVQHAQNNLAQSENKSVPKSVDHDHGYCVDIQLSSPESILSYRCDCCGKSTIQLIQEHQRGHRNEMASTKTKKRSRTRPEKNRIRQKKETPLENQPKRPSSETPAESLSEWPLETPLETLSEIPLETPSEMPLEAPWEIPEFEPEDVAHIKMEPEFLE